MSPLLELARLGQSYWLDDLSLPDDRERRTATAGDGGGADRRYGESRDLPARPFSLPCSP